MQRLKVLLINLNQVGIGTYQRAYNFGRILTKRGHQVTLMSMSKSERFRLNERVEEGIHLVETPDLLVGSLRSGWDIWDTWSRIHWINNKSFDIVHAIESRPVVIWPALFAHRYGAKLVMDWCDYFGKGGLVEERPNPLTRCILRPVETYFEEHFRTCADGTLTISNFLRERAIKLGVPSDKILVLRNGCDLTIPVLKKLDSRVSEGLPREAPIIGFIGRIFWRDAVFMAEAFNAISKEIPQVRLLLIGYFNRDIEQLLDHPANLISTDWVNFVRMYRLLAACDVCWLPFIDSGANQARWPGKLNDYMAASKPVVSTVVGEHPAIISQYQFGTVTPVNPKMFAEGTISLLDNEKSRLIMGQTARTTAEKYFSWDKVVDELEKFYESVINRSNDH